MQSLQQKIHQDFSQCPKITQVPFFPMISRQFMIKTINLNECLAHFGRSKKFPLLNSPPFGVGKLSATWPPFPWKKISKVLCTKVGEAPTRCAIAEISATHPGGIFFWKTYPKTTVRKTSGWLDLNPFEKIWSSKMGILNRVRGENETYLSCHHLEDG